MKNNKILAVMLMAMVATAQPITILHAAPTKQINIKVDGFLQKTDYLPINMEGTTMVEAKTLFKILGIPKYIANVDTGKVTFYFLNKVVDMEVGKKTALVSGVTMALNQEPVNIDGKIYLPLRYVADRCNAVVEWKGETSTISLDTIAKNYSVIESIKRNINTDNVVSYTLVDAVAKVIANGNEMKKLDETIKDAKEEIDDLEPSYIILRDTTLEKIQAERTLRGYYDTISKAEIDKEKLKKSTENSIISTSNAIEKSSYDIMLLEKQIELEESNIKNMEVKESLGYETETNIKTAKNNLAQSKINLTTMKTNLANTKMGLNNTMGIAFDKDVLINYELDASTLKIDNLDKYIEQKIEKDINIQLLDIAFRYQGMIKRTHYDLPKGVRERKEEGLNEKDDVIDSNYRAAEAELKKAKEDLDYKMRKAYNNLLLLDEEYTSKKIDLDKAVDAYDKVSVNYETGGAVIHDVLTAELVLLKAEAALKQNRLDYALSKYKIENPMFLS